MCDVIKKTCSAGRGAGGRVHTHTQSLSLRRPSHSGLRIRMSPNGRDTEITLLEVQGQPLSKWQGLGKRVVLNAV